ncbi:MAG: nuclear transport factor 2 family protein [Myxococcales bacterium]|jgi:ketosteroid isomerase-like protein|nr:nuclear transport factor 2 family protein [Myxococcales bacterium]
MSADPRSVADAFYGAFARREGAAMAALYSDNATFSDPVFPGLRGAEVGSMWKMLTERSRDFRLTHKIVEVKGNVVVVDWEAHYTFSATGRSVHNIIRGELTIENGKIVAHVDHFDLYRWMRMALGPKGVLLGWLPPVQAALRGKARAGLSDYMSKH